MNYPAQIVHDYLSWQPAGVEQIGQLDNTHATLIIDHVGRNIGAYGVFGTMFYDIARDSQPTAPTNRLAVAQQSMLMASTLEVIDTAIDTPNPDQTIDGVERFLDNCRDALIDGSQAEIVDGISDAAWQMACYGIASYMHGIRSTDDNTRSISDILEQLKQPVLQQFSAVDPDELLVITAEISGNCTEAAVLSSEQVDDRQYSTMRLAAHHFGAAAGILDHGSEVLADMHEGSSTFATAYFVKYGVSPETIKAVREMRQDAVSDHFKAGEAGLGSQYQRSIYKLAGRILTTRYVVRRAQERVTVHKLEAALDASQAQPGTHRDGQ